MKSLNLRALLFTAAVLAASPLVHATTPISLWKGEGNFNDAQGANPGININSVGFTSGVVTGQQFLFNNPTQAINVASPTFNSVASGFTLAGWINISSFGNGAPSIIDFRTTSNVGGFTLFQKFNSTDTLSFYVNYSGVSNDYHGVEAAGWNTNTDYFFTATFDAATGALALYRNGLPVIAGNTGSPGSPFFPVTVPPYDNNALNWVFEIGRNNVTGASFAGKMDEIQIHSGAMAPAEVTALYAAAQTPEPSSAMLLVGGIMTLLAKRWRAVVRS